MSSHRFCVSQRQTFICECCAATSMGAIVTASVDGCSVLGRVDLPSGWEWGKFYGETEPLCGDCVAALRDLAMGSTEKQGDER